MRHGLVYALTLAFTALLAFLTVWVIMREGVTIVVVAALAILALVVLGALGAMGRREGES
jgi:uncharacterized membrane protein (DUF4010 family)